MGMRYIEVSQEWVHRLLTGQRLSGGEAVTSNLPADARVAFLEPDNARRVVRVFVASTEWVGDESLDEIPPFELVFTASAPEAAPIHAVKLVARIVLAHLDPEWEASSPNTVRVLREWSA